MPRLPATPAPQPHAHPLLEPRLQCRLAPNSPSPKGPDACHPKEPLSRPPPQEASPVLPEGRGRFQGQGFSSGNLSLLLCRMGRTHDRPTSARAAQGAPPCGKTQPGAESWAPRCVTPLPWLGAGGACTCMRTHTRSHACTRARSHARTLTRTRTHVHIHTNAHTRAPGQSSEGLPTPRQSGSPPPPGRLRSSPPGLSSPALATAHPRRPGIRVAGCQRRRLQRERGARGQLHPLHHPIP